MMRNQRLGARYLAGFVIAAALLHLAVTSAEAARRYLHWVDYLVLGLAPAVVAAFLGLRAWTDRGPSSWALSAAGLVVLFVALSLSEWTRVTF